MPLTTHEGVAISWEEVGDRASPPLLLIMGHAFGAGMWHRIVSQLAERHHVITYDNWGVGGSGCPDSPHTIERMARDAEAVLDAAEVRRAHLFGLGMGGLVAQELAITRPTRVGALILGNTGCPDGPNDPLHDLPISSFFKLDRETMYGPATPDEILDHDATVIRSTPVSTAGLKAQATAVASYSSLDRVSGITAPTLVVHGDLDRVVPLSKGLELADEIPEAELMVVPATGHNLTSPYAGPLCQAIGIFLARNWFTHGIPRQAG